MEGAGEGRGWAGPVSAAGKRHPRLDGTGWECTGSAGRWGHSRQKDRESGSRGAARASGCSCASECAPQGQLPRERNEVNKWAIDGAVGRQVRGQAAGQRGFKPAERGAGGAGSPPGGAGRGDTRGRGGAGRQVRGTPRGSPSGRRTGAALRGSLPRRLRPSRSPPASPAPLLLPVSQAAGSAFPARAVPCLGGSGFPPSVPLLSSQPLDFIAPRLSSPPPRPTDSSFSIWPLIRLLLIFPPAAFLFLFFFFLFFLFSFSFSLFLFLFLPPPLLFLSFCFLPASIPSSPPRRGTRTARVPTKLRPGPAAPRPAGSRLICCLPGPAGARCGGRRRGAQALRGAPPGLSPRPGPARPGGREGGLLRGGAAPWKRLTVVRSAKSAPEEISWVCGIILIKIIDSYCTCESAGKGCLPK